MKKRTVVLLTSVAAAMILAGCAGSTGLETDELTISKYKGVEVDEVEKPGEITDEDVEEAIQTALEGNPMEITERAVQEGDTATIDFVGKMDGVAFEGGSSTDYPLEIGSNSFIDGFEDSVIGHNVGDTYDWEGVFPEDYGNADYAGKDVVFTITVKSISAPAELTDEFVKTVSEESETVDEYKEEMKAQLEEDAQEEYESTLRQSVWQAVLDNTEVKEYPEDEVKELSDSLIDQYKTAAQYYGMEYDDFIEAQMGYTTEEFEEQVDEAARSSVKQTMVVQAIADKEKIELSDEEYEKQLEQLAEDYEYPDVDSLKEAAEEEDLKEIALGNLVKDWLVEHCVQVASE